MRGPALFAILSRGFDGRNFSRNLSREKRWNQSAEGESVTNYNSLDSLNFYFIIHATEEIYMYSLFPNRYVASNFALSNNSSVRDACRNSRDKFSQLTRLCGRINCEVRRIRVEGSFPTKLLAVFPLVHEVARRKIPPANGGIVFPRHDSLGSYVFRPITARGLYVFPGRTPPVRLRARVWKIVLRNMTK